MQPQRIVPKRMHTRLYFVPRRAPRSICVPQSLLAGNGSFAGRLYALDERLGVLCPAGSVRDLTASVRLHPNDPVPGVHAPESPVRSVSICGRVQSGVPRCPARLCGLHFYGMEYFSGAFPFRLAGNWAGPVLRLRMQKPFCAEKNPACAGHSGAGGGR